MTTTVDDTLLDEEWLSAPRKRSRFRLVMVSALIASVFFLGGALTQKYLGADDTAAAAGAGGAAAGVPEGFGGGAGGAPSGFPGAGTGQQGGTGAESEGGAAEDEEEQVIGTVVEKNGDVWVVEDLGGTRHDVTVADDTKIIRETDLKASQVKAGDSVQITGTAGDGGQQQLQATDITLR